MSDGRDLPWFLQRLALDGTADQRAIRRAYAREVKQIDQGADAEGFQFLREAYETALRWEEYQRVYAQQEVALPGADADADTPNVTPGNAAAAARGAAPPPGIERALHGAPAEVAGDALRPAGAVPADSAAGAAPQPKGQAAASGQTGPQSSGFREPVPVQSDSVRLDQRQIDPVQTDAPQIDPPPSDPQQLSADVFEAFMAGCSGLAQGRTLHDAPAWELHLRTCLNDDRLMNLAARGIFEARVLHLLAGGWRPGNETLLEAAADVFQWRRDRHRLLRFGHAGAIVDRGIDERSMFDNQEHDLKAMQRQVILRLRELDMPEPGQLRADMPHVEQLAARFPIWLELVASMDNLELWRSAYATLPAPAAPPGYGAVPSTWTVTGTARNPPHPAEQDVEDSDDSGGSRPIRPSVKDRIKRIAWRFALGFIAFNLALMLVRVFVINHAPPIKTGPAAAAPPIKTGPAAAAPPPAPQGTTAPETPPPP